MTGIWAIYFRYEAYRQRCGQVLRPSEYKILQISRSDADEPKFEGFEFGVYLVPLRDTDCENLPKRVYEKLQKRGKFSAEIASPDQKDASGEMLLNLAIAADDAVAIPLDRGAEVNLASRGLRADTARALLQKRKYF